MKPIATSMIASALSSILIGACGSEPMPAPVAVQIRGQMVDETQNGLSSNLEVLILWQGAGTSLHRIMTTGTVPQAFTLDIREPPSTDILGEEGGYLRGAAGSIYALPMGANDGSLAGNHLPEALENISPVGKVERQTVLYLKTDYRGDIDEFNDLIGERTLKAGFHLMDIVPRTDPRCANRRRGDACLRPTATGLSASLDLRVVDSFGQLDTLDWD